jgi:hypothetical protein
VRMYVEIQEDIFQLFMCKGLTGTKDKSPYLALPALLSVRMTAGPNSSYPTPISTK